MTEIELRSCAKVNLTLEVGRIRPDGFHEIDSITQTIDLYDELTVSRAKEGSIEVSVIGTGAPEGRKNLVYAACETFVNATDVRGGARVTLRKRIPMQAGLGGGSSNAAAAIAGLNILYDCNLSMQKRAAIGAQVGSDVALFVVGGTTRIKGRGDHLTMLPDAPELCLAVLKPHEGVSTAWAYAVLDRQFEAGSSGSSDRAERAIIKGDRSGLVRCLSNDFDRVIPGLVETALQARKALENAGAERVLLAGSGSAVFGVFESMDRAESAAEMLSARFPQSYAVRTLSRAQSAPIGH